MDLDEYISLGSEFFDGSSTHIENYVRVHSGKASSSEEMALKFSYVSTLLNYKEKLYRFVVNCHDIYHLMLELENLTSDDTSVDELETFQRGWVYGEKVIVPKIFHKYDEQMTKNAELISLARMRWGFFEKVGNFEEIGKIFKPIQSQITSLGNNFNIETVQRLFEHMAMLWCLRLPHRNWSVDATPGPTTDFFLYLGNNTGLFGLNAYLFAYFHGVHIVGVPSMYQNYDQRRGCPGDFIQHDRDHSSDMLEGESFFKDFKELYFGLLTKPSRASQLTILVLWMTIHECDVGKTSWMENSGNPFTNYGEKWTSFLSPTIAIEFYPEFVSYRDLYLSEEIYDKVPKQMSLWHDKGELPMSEVKSYNDLLNILDDTSLKNLRFRSTLCMVLMQEFVRQYTQENFSDQLKVFNVEEF